MAAPSPAAAGKDRPKPGEIDRVRVLDRPSGAGQGTPRVLSDRLIFIDNLRTILTVTVVLHHLAVTYAWSQGWYVHEPVGPGVVSDVLSAFILLTQAFFMGAFYLIAAYFIPGSYERRGERSFVAERLRRLLIPLLIFRFAISPLTSMTVIWVQSGNSPGPGRLSGSDQRRAALVRGVAARPQRGLGRLAPLPARTPPRHPVDVEAAQRPGVDRIRSGTRPADLGVAN